MPTTEEMDRLHREDLQRLRNFRLMDDDFMTKCFEGRPDCIQLVLRIVMDMPDLEVTDVRTQVFVENLLDRSVRLDILATDSAGRRINVEIQRADKGAGKHRARYNSSMMDANLLDKGEDFDRLPETYVIFITENDVMGKGLAVYPIERCILPTGEKFGDGSHILYVNGAYRDNNPIGQLMHDFACTDPGEMNYEILADRARFFKESKEGTVIMCRAMEEMRNQSLEQGREEGREEGREQGMREKALSTAEQMLKDGAFTLEKIAKYVGLPIDELKKLQGKLSPGT